MPCQDPIQQLLDPLRDLEQLSKPKKIAKVWKNVCITVPFNAKSFKKLSFSTKIFASTLQKG